MKDISPEEKLRRGADELDTLRQIYERWLKSDIDWAVEELHTNGSSGNEDEWEFLRGDWLEKWEQWLKPYVNRLHETEHLTDEQVREFIAWIYDTIEIMMAVLYKLGETLDGT